MLRIRLSPRISLQWHRFTPRCNGSPNVRATALKTAVHFYSHPLIKFVEVSQLLLDFPRDYLRYVQWCGDMFHVYILGRQFSDFISVWFNKRLLMLPLFSSNWKSKIKNNRFSFLKYVNRYLYKEVCLYE